MVSGDKILSVILFFVMNWGFGYSVTFFLKNTESFLERNLIRIGIGMGVIPILGIILNFVHIPLYWWIFLVLSLAMPLFFLIRHINNKTLFNFNSINISELLKIKKSSIYLIIVILMFFSILYVMNKGTFVNPWLEDGDSWGHMGYMRYVELEKTLLYPEGIPMIHYAPPYPPGYDLTLAIFSQSNSSPFWTMKFFNLLIISLATIFIYLFVKEFSKDSSIALFSALILTIIPSFLSHFIWSTVLGIVLFFPALYCVVMLDHDKKWLIPSIIVIASILVTVPVTAFYFGAFLGLYWLGKVIATRKLNLSIIMAGLGSLVLSMFFWLHMFIKYGLEKVFLHLRLFRAGSISYKKIIDLHGTGAVMRNPDGSVMMNPDGTVATLKYHFNDFFVAPKQNMINNPTGIGVLLTILVIIGIIYLFYKIIAKRKELKQFFIENSWLVISFIWFIFALLSVLGEYFPYRMPYPFRAWSYLAIPVAIIGSFGYIALARLSRKIKLPVIIMLLIVFIGLLLTSGYQKYTVNTSIWSSENFYGPNAFEEVKPFLWMKDNLQKDTKVLSYCGDWLDVLGFDKLQEGWLPEIGNFNKDVINMSVEDVASFMSKYEYSYLIVDVQCLKNYNITFTNERLQDIATSGKFEIVYNSPTGNILRKR